MNRKMRLLGGLFLVIGLILGMGLAQVVLAADPIVLVDNLQPSWTAPGGGGVFSAYIGPPAYGYVSPGTTALYDGREAGIIKAGLAPDPTSGNYQDEGLFAFQPTVTIDAFAAGTVSYDIETQAGVNPVWMTIEIDTGVVGDRGDNTTYQHVPTSNPAGWHTVDAAAGQWQKWNDNNGDVSGNPLISLSDVATAHTGCNVVRTYLRLGMGNSYNNGGTGTIAWVDKASVGGVTYDFVVPTYWYVATTGSDTNEGTLASPFLTIQKAIDSAGAGDTIHVAAGTYPEQVTINKDVDLIGAGEASTTIVAPATRAGTVTQGSTIHDYLLAAYATSGTIDVRVEGFTFDINGQNKTAGTARLDGVFFRDVKDAGGTMAGLFSSTIHNFAATPDYEAWGLAIYGDSLLTVNDNDISDYTRDGLLVVGGNVTISNNTVTGSATPLNGINIQDVTAGAVTGNTVSGHSRNLPWAGGGILAWTCSGLTISGNHVDGNFYGIDLLDGSHDVTVSDNELTDNIKRGISLSDSDNNTVSGNTITGPAGGTDDVGIGLANTSTGNMIGGPTLADGNTITMATAGTGNLYAVYMQADVATGSNTIRYNAITGGKRAVQFDGPPGITGITTVSNNTISGPSFGGILAYNNGDLVITGNTLTNAVRPIEFFGPVNVSISGNTINGAAFDAVNAGSCSGTLSISGNSIYNIPVNLYALHLRSDCDNPVIDNNEIYDSDRGIIIDAGCTGAQITNNNIHDNDFLGIEIHEVVSSLTGNFLDNNWRGIETWSALTAIRNSITNHPYGAVILHHAGPHDVSLNWWGDFAPAVVGGRIVKNGNPVDYTPWLGLGTDTAPGTAGFQPDLSVLWVDDDSAQNGTTGRIQEGIDLVSGSTVYVAAGTYTGFTVNKTLTLLGAKHDVDPAGALYRGAADDSDESVVTGAVTITADNVVLNGFKLTNNTIAAGYTSALDVNVSYNILENGTATWGAIHLHTGQCDGGYVGYNTISGVTGHGIWNVANDDVVIEYNHILSVTGTGIESMNHAGTGIVISNNTITNPGGKGINYWGGDGATISGNIITNTGNEGIYLSSGHVDDTVSGNVIDNAGGFPILADTRVVIDGNTVTNSTDGIRINYAGTSTSDRVEVTGNTVSYIKYAGINIIGAYAYVHGNTVHHSNYYGSDSLGDFDYASIHMEASATNSIIDGNTVYDGVNGIQTWANDVTITNNEIYDMGVTYGNEKIVDLRTYKNSAILVGSNWGSGDIDPTGVVIQHNSIHDNYWGLFYSADLSNGVNAEYNWWGDASGPFDLLGTIECSPGNCNADATLDKNLDGLGNAVSENVDYCPWLDGPPTEAGTHLYLDPAFGSILNDNTATQTYTVRIANAVDLYGYQFVVTFDPANVECTAAAFDGSFFPTGVGESYAGWNAIIDNVNGKVSFSRTLLSPEPAKNGNGPLATLTLRGTSGATAGQYKLDFDQVKLSDVDANVLPVTTQFGWLELYDTGSLAGSVDVQGRANESGGVVTIMSSTGYTATLTITAADGSWSFTNIPAGDYQVNIEMERYLDAQAGDASLGVWVTVTGGSTTTLNKVKLLGGDAYEDDVIDISDAALIGGLFGTTVDPATTSADINYDGVVDILDLVLMGGNYGKSSPVPWTL